MNAFKFLSTAMLVAGMAAAGIAQQTPAKNAEHAASAEKKATEGEKHPAAHEKSAAASQQHAATASKGKKPEESPGWFIFEEEWWYPMRLESLHALNNARYHYRRSEEKAAAHEMERAVSWLRFAEGHSKEGTKEKLSRAANDLSVMARNLEKGEIAEAAHFDGALARASHALAEWHWFRAKDKVAKKEEGEAAHELAAAVEHIEHAATSAHHQFGPDTISTFHRVRRHGWHSKTVETKVDHNVLGKDLDEIGRALKSLEESLTKLSR